MKDVSRWGVSISSLGASDRGNNLKLGNECKTCAEERLRPEMLQVATPAPLSRQSKRDAVVRDTHERQDEVQRDVPSEDMRAVGVVQGIEDVLADWGKKDSTERSKRPAKPY